MPVKLRTAKARSGRITPEVIENFRIAAALENHWENRTAAPGEFVHGPCDECDRYLEAFHAVNRALGFRPFEMTPVHPDRHPDYTDAELLACGDPFVATLPRAREARRQLLKAAGLTDPPEDTPPCP